MNEDYKCLPERKKHYFGQSRGTAVGMAMPPQERCVWCHKQRKTPYHSYWSTVLDNAMRIHNQIKEKKSLSKKDKRFVKRWRKKAGLEITD
jgi:hypothetical protein